MDSRQPWLIIYM